MIAVDTNVLVYSHRLESPFHQRAHEVIEGLRANSASWAIPWPCIHEFIAIVSHPKIFKMPTPLEASFACIDAWLANGNLQLIGESDGYIAKLRSLAINAKVKGARIHDARIAAVCVHHGVSELWTSDRDFSPFHQLKTRNPLIAN